MELSLAKYGAMYRSYIVPGAAFLLALSAPVVARASVLILFLLTILLVAEHLTSRPRFGWPAMGRYAGPVLLVVWAAISAFWSLTPADSLRSAGALAGLLVAGFLLIAVLGAAPAAIRDPNGASGDDLRQALVGGLAAAFAIYLFEAISWGWLTRALHGFEWPDIIDDAAGGIPVLAYLINGTAILSLLVWPMLALCIAQGRTKIALISIAAVTLATAYFGSESGVLALLTGAVFWAAAHIWARGAVRVMAILFVVVVLGSPFAVHRAMQSIDLPQFAAQTHDRVPSSALIRLYIWKFATDRIAEHPVIGWGFNMARAIPGGGEKFQARTADGKILFEEFNLPLHPHNQILQVWLELGAIGALIVAATGAGFILRLGSWPSPARQSALALCANALIYDGLSFGAWQSWWIAVVFLVAALMTAVRTFNAPKAQSLAAA